MDGITIRGPRKVEKWLNIFSPTATERRVLVGQVRPGLTSFLKFGGKLNH